ncbi:hypothetical protein [Gemmatimonas aurantiaca]|uniref:hypothetical protein n=1 Tax=Gemmatimonas aurantiaca TaxID=173480 RepID=UPI00301C35C0
MLSILGSGGFADIIDLGDETVAKVYRRAKHTHDPVEDWEDHDFVTARLFEAEVRAYESIQDDSELVRFTPKYFGRLDLAGLDLGPSSTGQPYVPRCAFRIERLSGHDVKVRDVAGPPREEMENVLKLIAARLPRIDVLDASCFVPGAREAFTIIDFALWSGHSNAQFYLSTYGRLSPELRAGLTAGDP